MADVEDVVAVSIEGDAEGARVAVAAGEIAELILLTRPAVVK